MSITLSTAAIDFSRVNVSWQYDPLAEIRVGHRVIQEGEALTVFFQFQTDSIAQWKFEFWLQEGYETNNHRVFTSAEVDTLLVQKSKGVYQLKFQKPSENLLVLKITNDDIFYFYDLPLKNGSLPFPPIYPQDEEGFPVFENYLNTSSFKWVGSSSFHALKYQDVFELADPPMGEMKPLAPSLQPDSSFTFTGSVSLDDGYFYVLREDSTTATGITMLKAPPYFPEFKLLGELTSSMYYILNDQERRGLETTPNLKQSFDSFWTRTFATKFRARNAIRRYFNWVEQANRLFTDFKQGWKTDRGMLFIVFGVPDEVYRLDGSEEWYYDQGPAFEFTVISTFFAPRTYALRRNVSLEKQWYEYIAAIRRGANE